MSGTAVDDRLGRTRLPTLHHMCINLRENTGLLRISLFKSQNKSPLLHILEKGGQLLWRETAADGFCVSERSYGEDGDLNIVSWRSSSEAKPRDLKESESVCGGAINMLRYTCSSAA